jgi:small subunit ribosomal protein S18
MKREMPKKRRKIKFIKRTCRFCENPLEVIDFKNVELLRKFQTEKGKILQRKMTGNCLRHQRILSAAVKRARELALVY